VRGAGGLAQFHSPSCASSTAGRFRQNKSAAAKQEHRAYGLKRGHSIAAKLRFPDPPCGLQILGVKHDSLQTYFPPLLPAIMALTRHTKGPHLSAALTLMEGHTWGLTCKTAWTRSHGQNVGISGPQDLKGDGRALGYHWRFATSQK